jgi:hypothetical protein
MCCCELCEFPGFCWPPGSGDDRSGHVASALYKQKREVQMTEIEAQYCREAKRKTPSL